MQPPPSAGPNPDLVAAPYTGYALIGLGLVFAVLLLALGYYWLRDRLTGHRES